MYIVETLTERDGIPIAVDAHLKQSVMSCRPDIGLGDNPPPHLPASRLRLPAADGQNGRTQKAQGTADQMERFWNNRTLCWIESFANRRTRFEPNHPDP